MDRKEGYGVFKFANGNKFEVQYGVYFVFELINRRKGLKKEHVLKIHW